MDKICQRCGKHFEGFSWEDRRYCYRCLKEIALERTQEAIRNNEEDSIYYDTTSDDYVICPWCGDAVEFQPGSYEDSPEHYEEGYHIMKCENCGKDFRLEVRCSWSCETWKLEEDE